MAGGSGEGLAGRSRLTLSGAFELVVDGSAVSLPHSAERVLAFVALSGAAVHRTRVAANLWTDVPAPRAANNLRTALWRLTRTGADLVEVIDQRLQVSSGLVVDTVTITDLAIRMVRNPAPALLSHVPTLLRTAELLPDWEDEWVVLDRERIRLLRIEALEAAATALLGGGMLGEALLVASAVVQLQPARDSARRLVVQVHLARGNVVEALATYRAYRELLRTDYGVEPSSTMQRLVEPWRECLTSQ